jgi:FKBP-type peptidyl-prolyl cis-trans isomerase FkpA
MSTRTFALTLALALAAPAALHAQQVELKTADQKALYAIGTGEARTLQDLNVTPEELKYFIAGLQEQYGKKARLDLGDREVAANVERFRRDRIQAAMEREDKESKKFVAAAAKEKGAKKLEGGVVFLELKAGEGAQAKDTDRVRILYKGTLRNGTPFDAVLDPSKAAEFDLGLMIPCWQQAIAQMRVGGKARFVCPSDTAYGNRGVAPIITPYAALQFEVELLEIVPQPPLVAPAPTSEKPKPKK